MYRSDEFPAAEVGIDHRGLDPAPLRRVSAHRPAAMQLPDDSRLATAFVLAHINGNSDHVTRAGALEALTQRAQALSSVDPSEAIEALADMLPVLNSLFLVYSAESASAKNLDAKRTYAKLAMAAQDRYCRTQALVIGLRVQSQGRGQVVIEGEGES